MGKEVKGKKLTKAQIRKADRIAKLIRELKLDGVETIGMCSKLSFFRGEIKFDEFPDGSGYDPSPAVIFNDYNP